MIHNALTNMNSVFSLSLFLFICCG